jgi:predicted S18 family serine protease
VNATIIGTLIGGVLLFLSSILVPVIAKRLNKATDAATNAEKLSTSAVKIVEKLESRLDETENELGQTKSRCDQCLEDLGVAISRADAAEARADAAERRADRNDRTNTALIDAWTEALPLLEADAEATKFLRATIRAARQARYE